VIRVETWDLADLRHAFILDEYPVDGDLSGEFHLYGNYLEPYGFGSLKVAPGVAYGETLASTSMSLRFVGPGVWLDGIDIRKGSTGTIRGTAHVEWAGSYSYAVDGSRIPIESVDAMAFPQAPLTGRLEFSSTGGGAFLYPKNDVKYTIQDLFVKDEGIGVVTGNLELRGDDMNFDFVAQSSRLGASGAGKVTLLGNYPGDITLRMTDTSLDPYARVFAPGLSPFATAVASGTMRISGSLASLDNVVARVQVDKLGVQLFDYQLRNDGAIDAGLEQGMLRIGRFRLTGQDTSLGIAGYVDVLQGGVDLRASGSANLGVLQAFDLNVRGSGRAELAANISGTLERPQIGGSATMTGGRLRHMDLPHAIDNINGTIIFAGNSIRFDDPSVPVGQRLSATMGNGAVRVGGRIGLTGLSPSQFDLTVSGEGMEVRYPAGFRSVVDAELGLRGTIDDPVLSGSVLVRSGTMPRTVDISASLVESAGTAGGGTAGVASAAPPVQFPLRFDLRLTAPSTLEINNRMEYAGLSLQARLTASADLRLRGTYDKPVLEGRAAIERGEVLFEGRRYIVSRGNVDFRNPTKIEPYFDVEAETRVRAPGQTYHVTLAATGTVQSFEPSLSSDPPLPEVDILSLLLGDAGSTQDAELRPLKAQDLSEQNLVQARAARFLASTVSGNVQKAVEQTLGLDSVQITPFVVDPNQQSGRFSPGARLTIGKRISDRVYLTYSRSLTSTARDQVILLEYDQSDRFSWVVTQNEDRTYALDVRVRYVFR